MIAGGEVRVGDDVVTDPRAAFETAGLEFSVYDEPWLYREQVYIALNKPAGNHCTALCRTQIGELTLQSLRLAEGEWCHLETDALALLRPHGIDTNGAPALK